MMHPPLVYNPLRHNPDRLSFCTTTEAGVQRRACCLQGQPGSRRHLTELPHLTRLRGRSPTTESRLPRAPAWEAKCMCIELLGLAAADDHAWDTCGASLHAVPGQCDMADLPARISDARA